MRIRHVTAIALLAGLTALTSVTACSNRSTETTAEQQQTQTQTAPALSVAQIELGRNVDADKRVSEKTTEFRPNETVYASVLTNGVAENAEVKVRWTYQDGQVVDESVQTISPTGSAATEFHITKPDGLPAGKYKVEVFVNGVPSGSEEFEVKTA